MFTTVIYHPAAANSLALKARFQSELETLHDQYQFSGATAGKYMHNPGGSPMAVILIIAFIGLPEDGYRHGFRISTENLIRAE
jgi:hypothetical protein